MPVAQQVIVVVEGEIQRLSKTGGSQAEIESLHVLLEEARASEDGTVSEASVLESGLHPDHAQKLIS
jgi:hypothetical protein